MLPDDCPVMSIAELAKELHISNPTAYGLARRNALPVPTIFIGERRMCVSRAAVLRLLNDGKTDQIAKGR